MSGVETADVPEFFLACEPNPSSEKLNIAFGANALTTTRGTVRLVSALGHEVAPIFDGDLTEKKNLSISTDNLASGMYLLIIQSGQFSQSKTVQIQH